MANNVVDLFGKAGATKGPSRRPRGRAAQTPPPSIDFNTLIEGSLYQINDRFRQEPEKYLPEIDKNLAISTDLLNDTQLMVMAARISGCADAVNEIEYNRDCILDQVTQLGIRYLELKHWYKKKFAKDYCSQYQNG